jgi:hypothetical protein
MAGRIAALLMSVVALCACSTVDAQALTTAELHVGVRPERLGAGTTMTFGFQIASAGQALPAALTRLDVQLPAGMGIDTLGLSRCSRAPLIAHGANACSVNARVGSGSVYVMVPLGDVIRPELANLTVFNGPRSEGHETLLFYAVGRVPIATRLVFTGVIVPSPLGWSIQARIPLIPTLPESPDAAIVRMTSTLGTRGRIYYRTVAGRRVRFTPKGATLPGSCPPDGFPFSAKFQFNDTTSATATTTVACRE